MGEQISGLKKVQVDPVVSSRPLICRPINQTGVLQTSQQL